MESGAIYENTATVAGGGIYNYTQDGYADTTFTMQGGEISGNSAPNGAGITNYSVVRLESGEIKNNTAEEYGGGVYTSDYNKLDVAEGVIFSGNAASRVYERDRGDTVIETAYQQHVKATRWTEPLTQGYNNYDIIYSDAIVSATFFVRTDDETEPETVAELVLFDNEAPGERMPGNPVREGFVFAGWWTKDGTDDDWGEQFTKDTPASESITLYAKWALPVYYSVTYVGNGNTGGAVPEDSGSPYLAGDTVTILGQGELTRSDYTFRGWATSAGGDVLYNPGETFMIAGDTILYAVWESNDVPKPSDSPNNPQPSSPSRPDPTPTFPSNVPRTGDSGVAGYLIAMLVSALLAVALYLRNRARRRFK
jgi:uncharacterized repeat protein (TIGR02543 family)